MAFKAKMDEFINDVKSSIPAFTLTPSKSLRPTHKPAIETKSDDKMKNKFLEAWNNLRYDLGSGATLKKDIPIWILGICYHAKAALPEQWDDGDEEEVPVFEKGPAHAKAVFMDFASRPWFTYRKHFPPILGTNITTDTGWGCMLRSVQMMVAQGFFLHFLGREWRWLQRQSDTEKHLHRMILSWFIDDPGNHCPLSIHHLSEIGRKFGNIPGNWYGPNTVAYIVQEAVEKAKESGFPQIGQVAVYVAQDCTVYSEDVYDICGWTKEVHPKSPPAQIGDEDFQDSLSSCSVSSEASEMSSFLIPAITTEDITPYKKIDNLIPLTDFTDHSNFDTEVSVVLSPKNQTSNKYIPSHFSFPPAEKTNMIPCSKTEVVNQENAINFSMENMHNDRDACANTQPPSKNYAAKTEKLQSKPQSMPIVDKTHQSLGCDNMHSMLSDQSKPVPVVPLGYRQFPSPDSYSTPNVKSFPNSDSHYNIEKSHGKSTTVMSKTDTTPYDSVDRQREFSFAGSSSYPSSKDGPGLLFDPRARESLRRSCAGNTAKLPQHQSLDTSDCQSKSALILIPVRLGESSLNPIYVPCLQSMLLTDYSIGIIGGKPKHSLYFVGFQDENLLHLDPHYCQVADTPVGFKKNLHNYHTMSIRKTNIKKMDPSCCFGFYCKTAEDFERFKREAKSFVHPPQQHLSYPMCLFMEGSSGDHAIHTPPAQTATKESGPPQWEASSGKVETDAKGEVRLKELRTADEHSGMTHKGTNDEKSTSKSRKSQRKTRSRISADDHESKLNRLFPDASKFYPKFMRQQSSSPNRRKRGSAASLEHEFELL